MVTQQAFVRVHSIDRQIVAVLDVLVVFLVTFALVKPAALLPIGQIEWGFVAYVVTRNNPTTRSPDWIALLHK